MCKNQFRLKQLWKISDCITDLLIAGYDFVMIPLMLLDFTDSDTPELYVISRASQLFWNLDVIASFQVGYYDDR